MAICVISVHVSMTRDNPKASKARFIITRHNVAEIIVRFVVAIIFFAFISTKKVQDFTRDLSEARVNEK